MNMRQEEVVNEIRRMCGQAVRMQSLGWHSVITGRLTSMWWARTKACYASAFPLSRASVHMKGIG